MNREINLMAFWDVVVECLVEFHQHTYREAYKAALNLRAQLRQTPETVREQAGILVYHEEPFYVACNLAGKRLILADFREPYKKILKRHGW